MTLDEVHLELVSFCNASCSYCTWRSGNVDRKIMPVDMAYRLLTECKELGVRTVNLNGVGEPTLHPCLDMIVKKADELGLDYWLSTNCSTSVVALRGYQGLTLILSVPWVMKSKYVNVCLTNAIDYLQEKPANRRVYCQMVCSEEAEPYLQQMLSAFDPYVKAYDNVWIYLKAPLTWPDSDPVKGFDLSLYKDRPRYLVDEVVTPMSIGRVCDMPNRFLKVSADGTIAPCCVETKKRWGLQGSSLKEVWESDRMAEVRQGWKNMSDDLPCGKCLKRIDA